MRKLSLSLLVLLPFAACSSNKSDEPPPPRGNLRRVNEDPASSDLVNARAIFAQRCSACHGGEGRGDGPAAATLKPPPRDFHDAQWQRTVTDQQINDVIRAGGPATGKSPAMPAHPDLASKPEILAELVRLIRSFGQQP